MKKNLLRLTLVTTLLSSTSTTILTNSLLNIINKPTSELYVLGDSISDNGNIANIISNKSWNIHKINFQNPFYHNSFTNGDVAANVLAKKMGQNLIPAWNNGSTIGNNYAVAGAQASVNSRWGYKLFLNHYMLSQQTNKLLQEHQLNKNDLIFLEIGGNDILEAMEKKTTTDQETIINNAITNEFASIEQLINAGAKNLLISNVPNISEIPKYVTAPTPTKNLANHLSEAFNNEWRIRLAKVKQHHNQINIKAFDLENNFDKILHKGATNGKNITNASIKWSLSDLIFNKKPKYINGTTPETINNNIFFDDVHPNQFTHAILGNELYQLWKE